MKRVLDKGDGRREMEKGDKVIGGVKERRSSNWRGE